MDTLQAEGALSTDTRVVMPSVTLPNWTSHLTGNGPEQHGIVDNGWEIKKKNFPPAVSDEIGKYLDKLKKEGLYEDTHFLFLSDPGGIGYGHGGMSTDEMLVPWGITGPGIRKGFKLNEPNNTVNTVAIILHLFKVKQPNVWTGEVPMSIFK